MAKQIEFGKFRIIECVAAELSASCGGFGTCDSCGLPSNRGYYIAMINQWFCPECYEEWKLTAHYYPEDADIERRYFEFYAPRLGLKCQ